jgi:beta-galactosidase
VHLPNDYVDIYAPMYDDIEKMADYAQDPRYKQPMIQCEYAHAMGNSLGNLEDYWQTIRAHKQAAGRLRVGLGRPERVRARRTGPPLLGLRLRPQSRWGDNSVVGDGVVRADRTPDPEYYELQKVYSPVVFEGDPKAGNDRVVNRYDFRDLSGLGLRMGIARDGVQRRSGKLDGVNGRGRQGPVAMPPARAAPQCGGVLTVRCRPKKADIGRGVPPAPWSAGRSSCCRAGRRRAVPRAGRRCAGRRRGWRRRARSIDAKTGLVRYSVNGKPCSRAARPISGAA